MAEHPTYMRRAKALRKLGITEEDFRKLVEAEVIVARYRKGPTGQPEGYAYYRSDEVERAAEEGFSPKGTGNN